MCRRQTFSLASGVIRSEGKTVVLSAEEARKLLDSIDASSHVGLRDRALLALMVYTFARVGAALQMKVEDVYTQKRRSWVRLHEKRNHFGVAVDSRANIARAAAPLV